MDPQEKWLSATRRWDRRSWLRGRELGVWCWFFKEHPSLSCPIFTLPLSLNGGPPWREAEWLGPQCGSISSPLLISKAHYFVLRLAMGQDSLRAVPTDGRFLPSSPPHPRWPFTGTIIYFGEFLGYCFVRTNQGWVTNDPSGVVVAWPQPPLLPAP